MNWPLTYCCNALEQEISDPRVFICYAPKYREYYIGTIDPTIVRLIYMCPWCGTKLPKSLRIGLPFLKKNIILMIHGEKYKQN